MGKLFFISFLSFFSTAGFSQPLTDSLFGTWKVVKITPEPKDIDVKNKVNEIFLDAAFTFNTNYTLSFITKAKRTKEVTELLDMFNDKFWTIGKNNTVFIGDKPGDFSIGKLSLIRKNDKTFFIFTESPFTFEVVRQIKTD